MNLRSKLSQKKATVRIGKKGVTEEVLKEIKRQLEQKGYVKVKIEKSVIRILEMDRREVAKEVARRLGAELLEIRGRTFILIDKNKGIDVSEL